jgi:hypothetical protein
MSIATKTISFSCYPGGNVEITQAIVNVYHTSTGNPELLKSQTVTGPLFQYSLSIDNNDFYYVTVQVTAFKLDGSQYTLNNRNITLLALFNGSASSVYISAQSTIANAFALAQMIVVNTSTASITISGINDSIGPANGMRRNFFNTNGGVSKVISSSPNGLETNSYPMFNLLSNLAFYCLCEEDVYNDFLVLASFDQPRATSFFQGLMYLVHYPYTNVEPICSVISSKRQVFEPSISMVSTMPRNTSPIPDQWTLTIKVNNSGSKNFLPSGLAYVVFDKDNKAWIANNFRSGSGKSGTHCLVLNPDGSPASISPVFGGGLLGVGFGVATDLKREKIAFGNFGWGEELYNPQYGSVSMFKYDGTVQSPADGYTTGLSRVQGMCYDGSGNLWMASVGQQTPFAPGPPGVYEFEDQPSACVVYLGGNPNKVVSFQDFNGISPYHSTFDVSIDSNGDAVVTNIGDSDHDIPSSVFKLRLKDGALTCLASWTSDYQDKDPMDPGKQGYEELRQIAFDAHNNVFVAAVTSSRVIKFDTNLNYVGEFTNNIHNPWGVVIDKQGTIFVSNFGHDKKRSDPEHSLDMQGPFGVSVIKNQDDKTTRLMTVPTGGAEVMLSNGMPLYGNHNKTVNGNHMVSYEPIMRLTSSNIDVAGNLWAMNNWKPSAVVDVENNPGGDGVVIYVGVAAPM